MLLVVCAVVADRRPPALTRPLNQLAVTADLADEGQRPFIVAVGQAAESPSGPSMASPLWLNVRSRQRFAGF